MITEIDHHRKVYPVTDKPGKVLRQLFSTPVGLVYANTWLAEDRAVDKFIEACAFTEVCAHVTRKLQTRSASSPTPR